MLNNKERRGCLGLSMNDCVRSRDIKESVVRGKCRPKRSSGRVKELVELRNLSFSRG